MTGVGAGGTALRDLASEAAVGANSPVDGVLGRLAVGVLDLAAASERAGVFGTLGVGGGFATDLLVVALEATDWPVCWGFRG